MNKYNTVKFSEVAGVDLGDKYSQLCVIDVETGEILEESRMPTTSKALTRHFGSKAPMRIAIEVGTHSPWVSRLLEGYGHQVIVANARKVQLISQNKKKTDKVDAETLAFLARVDPRLLAPIKHRNEETQAALAVLRSRQALVECRTKLVTHVRGVVKAFGKRLPTCSTEAFDKKAFEKMPDSLKPALMPVIETIRVATAVIREYDRNIKRLTEEMFPEALKLQKIKGVGPITSLAFVLVLEDPNKFKKSRTVGAYLGLVPARDDSGDRSPQLRITKEGDAFLRTLLIQAAHYMMGAFGEECDLRRHGEKIAQRGGKNAKKRATTAVARKLSVLMHRLWQTGVEYDPNYNLRQTKSFKKVS